MTKGDQGVDSAKLTLTLQKHPAYSAFQMFGYLSSPNTLHRFLRIDDLKTTWPASKSETIRDLVVKSKIENNLSHIKSGIKVNFDKWCSKPYIEFHLKPW